MFPGIQGFAWDAGHIIFLGVFYAVLLVVFSTVLIAAFRALRNLKANRGEEVRWHMEFEDLPAAARACRHELAGEVAHRECPNAFDCRRCVDHPKFLTAHRPLDVASGDAMVGGFRLQPGRLFHRGHTWVKSEPDGTMTVGLDDLAEHLIGDPDRVRLPEIGSRTVVNGTGWMAWKKGIPVRVLAPIDGEVVAVGGAGQDWYLRIRPDGVADDRRHLLTFGEARPWMIREVERLHVALSSDAVGAALADGGTPVDDLTKVVPREDLDRIFGMLFLEA